MLMRNHNLIDLKKCNNDEHLKANMQSAKNIAIYFPFLEITRVTSIAVVIWFASLRINEGTLSCRGVGRSTCFI